MDDKLTDTNETDQQTDTPSVPPTVVAAAPEPAKPEKRPRLQFNRQKVLRWSALGVAVIVLAGLGTSTYLFYKKSNDLSKQNKSLSSTISSYKKADAKPTKLTDTALQSVASTITTQPAPAPADSGSFGGKAVQVNADDPTSASPKYVGGEYAPFWLLNHYTLTVPDATKMVRTTDVSTDGHLLTADKEGDAGCGGEGIYMTVTSILTQPGSPFRASGSSASYARGLGCGGADPIVAVYVKYTNMRTVSKYKYMEIATADCANKDSDYNCVGTTLDKTKWRLYAGIVLADAPAFKVGDSLQAYNIEKQLYNRDKNDAQFYFDCSTEQYSRFDCTAADYKNNDYNAALNDSAYTALKNIVLDMHEQ